MKDRLLEKLGENAEILLGEGLSIKAKALGLKTPQQMSALAIMLTEQVQSRKNLAFVSAVIGTIIGFLLMTAYCILRWVTCTAV